MSTPRYRSAPPSLSGSAISVSKAMTPSRPGLKSLSLINILRPAPDRVVGGACHSAPHAGGADRRPVPTRHTRPRRRLMARAPRPIEVSLPDLEPFPGGELAAGEDYDALDLRGLDLSGQVGRDARFLECALTDCRIDETDLRGARLSDCVLTG